MLVSALLAVIGHDAPMYTRALPFHDEGSSADCFVCSVTSESLSSYFFSCIHIYKNTTNIFFKILTMQLFIFKSSERHAFRWPYFCLCSVWYARCCVRCMLVGMYTTLCVVLNTERWTISSQIVAEHKKNRIGRKY